MWNELGRKLAYLAVLGVVIGLEHRWFARPWKRYERARWTMGVLTVLVLALPLALVGVIDLDTLAWMCVAFGVAGLVTAALYINEASEVNRRAREIAQADECGARVLGESDGTGGED